MPGQADIGIRVFLDNAASAGLGQINSQLVTMVDVLQRASGGLRVTQGQLMAMAAVAGAGVAFFAFGAAIKQSIDAAAEFQQSMFAVAVATHVPLDGAMQYAGALMNLAANSSYSSTEIANGIVILGRSGYALSDILAKTNGMAQAAIALGIATRSGAVDAFTLLAQTMSAYNATAQSSMHYADLLQFAFEHQTGSVSQLQSALAQVTPIAAAANIPFDQIVGALDVLGPAMGSTSKAGTALRYALAGMITPTAAGTKELASLGIIMVSDLNPAVKTFADNLVNAGVVTRDFANKNDTSVTGLQNLFKAAQTAGMIPLDQDFGTWAASTKMLSDKFFDAKGNAVDLTTMLQALATKLSTLPENAKLDALKAIFSVRGGQGIQDLLNNLAKYDGYMKQLSTTNDNAGGAMARLDQMMKTAQGAWAGFTSSVNDLKIAIGLDLLPYVAEFWTALNNAASAIRSAVQATGPAAATFLLLGAALSGVALVAGVIGLLIAGIGTTLAMFVGIMLASAVGIIAFSAGVAILVGWLTSSQAVINNVRTAFATLATALLVVGAAVLAIRLAPMLMTFLQMLPTLTALGADYIMLGAEMVAYGAIAAATAVRNTILNAGMLAGMIPTILRMAAAWLVDAAAMLLANAPMVLLVVAITAIVVGLGLLIAHLIQTGALMAFFRAAWATIGPPILAAGNAIRTAFLSAIQQLMPVWAQLVASFNTARPALMFLGAIIGGVIVAALILAVGAIMGFIMALARIIIMVIQVAAAVAQVVMGIIMVFTGLFTVIRGLVTGNTAMIQQGFGQMGQGIVNIVTGMWNAVKAVFVGAFSAIWGFVSGFVNIVVGLFHAMSSTLVGHSIIPDMMNAIVQVFTSALNVVRSVVMAGVNAIVSVFHMMQSMVTSAVTFAMSVVRALFQGGISAAAGVVNSGVAQIIAHFMSMPGPAGAAARSVISAMFSFSNGVASVAGQVSGAVGRVVGAFQSMAGGIGGAISGAIGWVNNLIGAISRIPSVGGGIHIPGFAQGAIVTSPTLAVVGEGSEPEMILPMSQYQAALQGAANMARAGGQGTGQGQQIVNNFIVDGKVVATSVMNTMTGQLQMNGMGRALR